MSLVLLLRLRKKEASSGRHCRPSQTHGFCQTWSPYPGDTVLCTAKYFTSSFENKVEIQETSLLKLFARIAGTINIPRESSNSPVFTLYLLKEMFKQGCFSRPLMSSLHIRYDFTTVGSMPLDINTFSSGLLLILHCRRPQRYGWWSWR